MAVNTHYYKHRIQRKTKTKKPAIDKLVYFAVVFGPVMTLPQIYDIWFLKKTEVSLVTWLAYMVIACIWLLYGLKHKDRPIIAVQALWLILDAALITGLLIA